MTHQIRKVRNRIYQQQSEFGFGFWILGSGFAAIVCLHFRRLTLIDIHVPSFIHLPPFLNPHSHLRTQIRFRAESSPCRKFNWLLIQDWQPTKVPAIVSSWQILALPLGWSCSTPPSALHTQSLSWFFDWFRNRIPYDLFSPGLLFVIRYSLGQLT